jgi:hypothetical protein
MNSDMQRLLIDAWRRGRAYFLIVGILSFGISVQIVKEGRLTLGTVAAAAIVWMGIPQFVFANTHSAYGALPVDWRTRGRLLWWSTYGGFAISSITLLTLIGTFSSLLGYGSIELSTYLACALALIGLCGHTVALTAVVAANAWAASTDEQPVELRVFRTIARVNLVLVIAGLIWFRSSPVAMAIAAVAGFAIAALGYRHAEWLARSEFTPTSRLERNVAPSPVRGDPNATGFLAWLRNHIRHILLILFLVTMAVLYLRDPETGATFKQVLPVLACLLALSLTMSGLAGSFTELISLHALRVLPLTNGQVARRLMYKSIAPVAKLGTLALALNLLLGIGESVAIVAATLHLASMQTFWPAFTLTDHARTPAKRIVIALFGLLWSVGGSFAIVSGADFLAWFGAPLLAAIGYSRTLRILEHGEFPRTRQNILTEFGQLQ